MTPYYSDDWLTLYGGDCREVLSSLPADLVDCVVTSPPYWGLRDYGTDGQLGLERTPEEYVANMVAVFREVRRVMKPSGTCWLNLGDSYATGGGAVGRAPGGGDQGERFIRAGMINTQPNRMKLPGLKPKDLVGIPWRVAFALQADGWYLRSDIIWSKPNPMPESVTDRPTKSHEYLFLLTKSARYYFDADAVREPHAAGDHHFRYNQADYTGPGTKYAEKVARGEVGAGAFSTSLNPAGRNIRSVWNIATRPYPGAHFAVFPPELPERCIKAGSSEKGVCPECGAPWERTLQRTPNPSKGTNIGYDMTGGAAKTSNPQTSKGMHRNGTNVAAPPPITLGWHPTCAHGAIAAADNRDRPGIAYQGQPPAPPLPAVILDPFGGSGTVGMVANRLSRRAILIDLNPEYLEQQMKRNAQTPLGLDAA